MYNVVYLQEVKSDLLEAKQWYLSQQVGLDIRFEAAVKDVISSVSQTPFAYAVKYMGVRIAHTKIFPYNIHFLIYEESNQIIIIGIVHNRRKNAINLDRKKKL